MASPESNGQVRSVADVARDIEERRKARAARDRSFELGGETFTYRPSVPMEAMAEYYDMASGQNIVSNADAINIIDSTVLAFLEPGQEEKWTKVRQDPENALSVWDCHELIEGLLETATGRPTLPPSVSTVGQKKSGTTSTEDSPSTEATSTA